MAGLSQEQVARGVLLVVVILSVFVMVGYFNPLGEAIKNIPCKYLDLCQDLETIEEIQRFKQSPQAFTLFVEEYKTCKAATTNDCLCNLTIPNLPEGIFISLRNENLFTDIALCQGKSTSATEYECGTENLLEEQEVRSDTLLVPTEEPTSLTNPLEVYPIKNGKLDLGKYQEAHALVLKTEDRTKVLTDKGLAEIDFYKVYKKDAVTMAFVPPLGSFGAIAKELGQTFDVSTQLQQNIPICTTTAGAPEALQVFDTFTKELRKCLPLYLNEKKQSDPFFILLGLEEENKALALFQYELNVDGKGQWKNTKAYSLHLTQGWFKNIPLAPPNMEQKEVAPEIKGQIEEILAQMQTKDAQQGATYLETFEQAKLSTETEQMLKTEETTSIDALAALEANIVPRTDEGVCGSVETKLPEGFTVAYAQNIWTLQQKEKVLKQMQMPVPLRKAEQQQAPQAATQVIQTYMIDQATVWVEFTRFKDGSVAVYPFTLEQVAQEAQERAEAAIRDQNI